MRLGKVVSRLSIIGIWIFLFFALLTATHYVRPSSQEGQVINIFSWPEVLSPETIENLQKETGIKVRRHYYTSNEELLVKLKATKGKGYDIIIPSDYAVTKLIEEDLIQPIDHSKLEFMEHLHPRLMGQYYDEKNTYSIPYIWEILGFGINTEPFETFPFEPTWQEIFCPTHPNVRVSMINDPIEAIDVTARHLFGIKEVFTPQETALIRSTLIEQRPVIEAYAGVRGDYLLVTKNCSVAVIPSSYIMRTAKGYSHIDFIVPKEYTFLSIENICIPKGAENTEIIYAFLNYLYKPEVFVKEVNAYYNFPAITNISGELDVPPTYLKTLKTFEDYTGTFHYTRDLFPEKESRSLWVQVKSK